ncbi:MAG: hypothetical protein DRQ44_11145 [Gammaproteobacteria bacterium]|nr:MAG: hypothetical protein DRQ44_11145 [Gammaproteobacteria bacterium]
MNSIKRSITKPTLIGLFIMLSACATQDMHLGEDVKSMQHAQVYDQYAAMKPVKDPVPQDGQKAQIVIDTFWEVGRQQKQIHNSIDINVGN